MEPTGKAIDPFAAASPDALVYAFKPSLAGAAWTFRLRPDVLEWTVGRRRGQVGYADIRRLRLSFRPISMQAYRFVAEIWPRHGAKLRIVSSTWRSMVEQRRQDAAYRDFIAALGHRIAGAQPAMSVEIGLAPPIYWPGAGMVVAVALGLAALEVRAVQLEAWSGAAFIGGFFMLFLWQTGTFLGRNRPARCRADALEDRVLP